MGIVTGQNALSTSAEEIFAANRGVKYREVKNMDASIVVYIGIAGVTTSTGYKLAAGESIGFEDEAARSSIYAIAASATPSICTIEW